MPPADSDTSEDLIAPTPLRPERSSMLSEHRDYEIEEVAAEGSGMRRLRPSRGHGHGHVTEDYSESESTDEEDEMDKVRLRQIQRVNTKSKDYTEEEEKAVLRKLDRKLVLFLLSFLDRSSMLPNEATRKLTC